MLIYWKQARYGCFFVQSYNKGRTRSNKSLFFCHCCPLKVFSDREIDGYRTPVSGVSAGKTKTGASPPTRLLKGRGGENKNRESLALGLLEKTKTGKTPCAGCKMSLASHGRCSRLKIPRASSGIFRRLHHPPIGFCIRRKAINKKNKPCPPRQESPPP